ncbi:MAG: aa3-type cytochrome c oxidase subunit IV [Pseudomonadota bacterium]
MAEQQHHEHGKMDITEQEQTFAGFLRVIMISVVIIAIILIFLALVNA